MYKTDSALIRHVFKELLSQIMKKYSFTTQEAFELLKAKEIMLKKADEIDKDNVQT